MSAGKLVNVFSQGADIGMTLPSNPPSIRLSIRGSEQGDLSFELVAQHPCNFQVEAQPGGDYNIRINRPIIAEAKSNGGQGKSDDTPNDTNVVNTVNDPDRNVVGIGNSYGVLGQCDSIGNSFGQIGQSNLHCQQGFGNSNSFHQAPRKVPA